MAEIIETHRRNAARPKLEFWFACDAGGAISLAPPLPLCAKSRMERAGGQKSGAKRRGKGEASGGGRNNLKQSKLKRSICSVSPGKPLRRSFYCIVFTSQLISSNPPSEYAAADYRAAPSRELKRTSTFGARVSLGVRGRITCRRRSAASIKFRQLHNRRKASASERNGDACANAEAETKRKRHINIIQIRHTINLYVSLRRFIGADAQCGENRRKKLISIGGT